MTADIEMKDFVRKLTIPDYRGCKTCRFYTLASLLLEEHDTATDEIAFCNYLQEDVALRTQCPYYAESDNSKTKNDPVVFDS